jgi:hypothetical protein
VTVGRCLDTHHGLRYRHLRARLGVRFRHPEQFVNRRGRK